jgi:hypothetical protein
MMPPESLCNPCNAVFTIKNNSNTFPYNYPYIAGHTIYMDLLPTFSRQGLTPATTFVCYLIMVGNTLIKPQVCGLKDYKSYPVIHYLNESTAPCKHPVSVEHINTRKVKTDAGSQFTSNNFCEACAAVDIELSIAALKHQEHNQNAERTWYYLQNIVYAMLVHARLPPKFTCHAIRYACEFSLSFLSRTLPKRQETLLHHMKYSIEINPQHTTPEYLDVPVLQISILLHFQKAMLPRTQQVRKLPEELSLDFLLTIKDGWSSCIDQIY